MRDITFVSGDGESLIVESPDGERLRLVVDRALRDALTRQPSNTGDHALSPREIQDAIRSGLTVDALASSSGESLDYILKFATPVIEELEHMVSMALAVRVEVGPDRFNEVRLREFGDLMMERLRNGGATGIEWSCSRTNATTWTIFANFETAGGRGVAEWTFDPRKSVIVPEDETAISLGNQTAFTDSPIPKVSARFETTSEQPVTELLDAFKARREAAAASQAEEMVAVEESEEQQVTETVDPKPKGRAPMPSWDDIVFGAKSDEKSTED